MANRVPKSSTSTAALPADYGPLLADIKARVQAARIKAGLAANRELLALYWDIGRLILRRQQVEGWGTKVVARLAVDLRTAFPMMSGFSARNLDYMLAFAGAWGGDVILQQPVAKLEAEGGASAAQGSGRKHSLTAVRESRGARIHLPAIVQPAVAQFPAIPPEPMASLPWGHNPIGVSGYLTKLVDSLPRALKGAIPSVAELEKGLTRE